MGAGGFGARVSWFHFDDAAHPITVQNNDTTGSLQLTSAGPFFGKSGANDAETVDDVDVFNGEQMVVTNTIKLDAIDLEATQAYNAGSWALLGAGGVRFAHLRQAYEAIATVPAIGRVTAVLNSRVTINGVGPTVALEARRTFGTSGVSLYGLARGALLFDERRKHAETQEFNNVVTGALTRHDTFNKQNENTLPVAEFEVGAEWAKDMGGFTPLIRVGYAGQTWFNSGSATAENGNLGLAGLVTAIGLSY